MRSRTAQWFVCKIRYDKVTGDGVTKKVTESFVIDALSFTEAEEPITEELMHYISGDFEVRDITLAPFREIFFSGEISDDRWYKAKLSFLSIDEKTMKEKRSSSYYLIQAGSMKRAVSNLDRALDGTMLNYLVSSVAETPYMDIFEYRAESDGSSNGNC